ncbi:MAG: hypothetical protein HY699_10510 [Deltaproteobacteria bacterium]|nr:hypothetical protein [Deltaproteobacteria bacterium]
MWCASDPNQPPATTWPRYDDAEPYLVFDRTISVANGPKAAACVFWKEILPQIDLVR